MWDLLWAKIALGQVFPRILRFSPGQFHSTSAQLKSKSRKISSSPSSSSRWSPGCEISLQVTVRPWQLLPDPSIKEYFIQI
jgi:hypothetical protein